MSGKILRFISYSITMLVLVITLSFSVNAQEEEEFIHARPSQSGALHVEGTQLTDGSGRPVILRGLSLHGLTWYPQFVSDSIFSQISQEWNCNLVRLPLYSEVYCKDNKDGLETLKAGIEYAISNDMYVLVDWHILNDYDPNMNIEEAIEFFEMISSEYGDTPNIIYEICNEPNGKADWGEVYSYCEKVIPVIRKNAKDAVIVVGTPDYDRNLISAMRRPLQFDNVMYVLHFYTATHGEGLQAVLLEALDDGLPVFISECGISEASGDGEVDYENARTWFGILRERGVSYAVWSLSDKNESSALLYPDYDPSKTITDADLTDVGFWIRALIQGQEPSTIEDPHDVTERAGLFRKLNLDVEKSVIIWPVVARTVFVILLITLLIYAAMKTASRKKHKTYCMLGEEQKKKYSTSKEKLFFFTRALVLLLSLFFSAMYLYWRIAYSIPVKFGPVAVACNIVLLIVEVIGFIESIVLYVNLSSQKKYELPLISPEEYPEVDIFIATYNEPEALLKKTINGCKHLKYPDISKVHIWVCDDNRRASIRQLAEKMNVGYFDRPDNEGAKAGNLNHAMGLTNAPYVCTLDADMIVKSDFLLKTIPYFVKAKRDGVPLGLLQTPQCFYEPDVYQYNLYSEKKAPNEQDFFYRTIEVAKTSTNSVIYGGSNTIISRQALEDVGGFYTGSITEDFATGVLIESKGYVSLGLAEPLASGKTPDSFKDHIKQRVRWGRGVISTAHKLHIFRIPGLSIFQKISYWSSVVYWYSPIKNLVYMLSPIMYALFAVPVFKCTFLDLLVYWLPMFLMQDICLRLYSGNAVSLKWSGIYETSVMPFLFIPVIKEFFGITTSKFAVTDKLGKAVKREVDRRDMQPFLVLIFLSVLAIVRICFLVNGFHTMGLLILAFWIIRNLYYLIMSIFLIQGRDGAVEEVTVIDAEPATARNKDGDVYEGVTTFLTEHSLKLYFDESVGFMIGDRADLTVNHDDIEANLSAVVTGITSLRGSDSVIYSFEILDYCEDENEYLQVIYDRIPSLPQSLVWDYGMITHLVRIIAHRILR